jgi:hypothetical protein
MNLPLHNSSQCTTDEEKRSNIDLIYGCTEALLKSQRESLTRLDTKLSAFLALSGVMLRLTFDFPVLSDPARFGHLTCNTCHLLKVLTYVSLITAVFVSSFGLTAQPKGKTTVRPDVLMEDDWYWEEEERCKAWIVKGWIETEKEYVKLGLAKVKKLNATIFLICLAVVFIGVNLILSTVYG